MYYIIRKDVNLTQGKDIGTPRVQAGQSFSRAEAVKNASEAGQTNGPLRLAHYVPLDGAWEALPRAPGGTLMRIPIRASC
jgi:hypothetical protein